MNHIIPNFFIVGAPKCGTTSLYNYLKDHENIFFPEIKETNFFSSDFEKIQRVNNKDDYLRLFKGVSQEHKVIGEASVSYLSSSVAIQSIVKFNPQAKFLIMLRDPCEMIYSMHSQLFYTGDEDQKNFKDAWGLVDERSAGNNIPKHCRVPFYLNYKEMALLGKQVQRVLDYVPLDRVLFIAQEDMKKDTQKVVNDVLHFLDLDTSFNFETKIFNSNKVPRFQFISQLYNKKLPTPVSKLFFRVKTLLGIEKFHLRATLQNWNRKEEPRAYLPSKIRMEMLDNQLREDISLLSRLTNKDFSKWVK